MTSPFVRFLRPGAIARTTYLTALTSSNGIRGVTRRVPASFLTIFATDQFAFPPPSGILHMACRRGPVAGTAKHLEHRTLRYLQ
jgi:hypothetical protein